MTGTLEAFADERVAVYGGDCRDLMAVLPDNSIDAVVTDPPYELAFMGRRWDATGIAYDEKVWLEALRILKPGGHALIFGGTRTAHRLFCAVEDAGFEIRDTIAWLYGQGWPKDKRVLKPGFEPIVAARKPPVGSITKNVGTWGTGALNITACKVPHASAADLHESETKNRHADFGSGPRANKVFGADTRDRGASGNYDGAAGRWPTNVVLTHQPLVDDDDGEVIGDACDPVCVDGCPVAELDAQSGTTPSNSRRDKGTGLGYHGANGSRGPWIGGDSGGASRFFPTFRYQAKAPSRERPKVDGVSHPTVKPLALMRWLVRLVTPPNGLVVDLFAGSGTTLEAAVLEGFRAIGADDQAEHLPLIRVRMERLPALESAA